MVEAKKAGAKSTRKGAKSVPEPSVLEPIPAQKASMIETQAGQMPQAAERVQRVAPKPERTDALRQAVSETVTVTARGVLEVNDKIIEALQSQSHAALDLWRNAITTAHLPEAFAAQTRVTREAYETASAQWKDIAETTARWFHKSLEPFQSVMHRHDR